MINIGDEFYMVNRNDRTSSFGDHDFIILTVTSVAKVAQYYGVEFNGCTVNLGDFIKGIYSLSSHLGNNFRYRNKVISNHANNFATCGETLEQILENLKENNGRNIYTEKELAKEEIKSLVKSQYLSIESKIIDLNKDLEKINNVLNKF